MYVEPKIVKLVEAEYRTVAAKGCGQEEMVRYWSKGTKFQLHKMNKFWR